MLTSQFPRRAGRITRRQEGVVLVIALIVLVAMTLGGIALVRSVYTANIIAGNMAFRESAVSSGDAGIEAAVTWLQSPSASCTDLGADCFSFGYAAYRTDPAAGQSWDDFWAGLVTAGQVRTLAADSAGNTVSYAIQRLCNAIGAAQDAGCSTAPATLTSGGNDQSGQTPLNSIARVYYRVTSRSSGPRNTVTYVQAIVAM
jgi:Tfp pilus assembly protein PilX